MTKTTGTGLKHQSGCIVKRLDGLHGCHRHQKMRPKVATLWTEIANSLKNCRVAEELAKQTVAFPHDARTAAKIEPSKSSPAGALAERQHSGAAGTQSR